MLASVGPTGPYSTMLASRSSISKKRRTRTRGYTFVFISHQRRSDEVWFKGQGTGSELLHGAPTHLDHLPQPIGKKSLKLFLGRVLFWAARRRHPAFTISHVVIFMKG